MYITTFVLLWELFLDI